IFVKNYIDQSQEFVLCTVVLAFPIITLLRGGKVRHALLLTLVVANFVVNMVFVVVSRTALVTLPVMLAVSAMAHVEWRTKVLQNMFSSLFNSHLFDFHEGWMYVLGVGIAGGMVLRARSEAESSGTARP